MHFVDVWTMLTGAASILSLLLVMSDKFPEWKKFIAPAGFILGGFAIGRISAAALPGAARSIQDTRFMGFLLILILILGALVIVFRMMTKKHQDWYLIFILFLVVSMGIPSLLEKYSAAFPDVPKEDYLLLANLKEERADLAGAVKYLEKYKALVSEAQVKSQVEKKILGIQSKQLVTK